MNAFSVCSASISRPTVVLTFYVNADLSYLMNDFIVQEDEAGVITRSGTNLTCPPLPLNLSVFSRLASEVSTGYLRHFHAVQVCYFYRAH